MHQNSLSLFQGYAASPKIKNGVLIHLPHCRSVGALDVVCINLQLWLGIRRGLISQQEVSICLLCIRFLRFLADMDSTVKNAFGSAIQDAIKIFMTQTMRLCMIDNHMVVGDTIIVSEVKSI